MRRHGDLAWLLTEVTNVLHRERRGERRDTRRAKRNTYRVLGNRTTAEVWRTGRSWGRDRYAGNRPPVQVDTQLARRRTIWLPVHCFLMMPYASPR